MLEIHDLAALAEMIDTPYRPRPLASLTGLDVSLLVAEGSASWFRQVSHAELLMVLEGVVTLDAPRGKVVLNEGELAAAARNARHHVQSGMRSTVLLFEEVKAADQANGHQALDMDVATVLEKRNPALDVRQALPFTWLPIGASGAYAAHATRLLGASAPYDVPAGSAVVVVYRGMLDYASEVGQGSLVGSQMLVARPGVRLTLASDHGATVLAVTRREAPLPEPAHGGSAVTGSEGAAA
jgi:hypothetical protein